MSKDTRSTIIGLVMACVIGAGTYFETNADPKHPLFWFGLVSAIAAAIKGYYHNKPTPDAPKEAA